MVSLKKIGAIATGALFIGATVGMAAAVTVPSDFKASMLADNGVAKAQLVVGKDAPGKAADTASAEIIAEAAKTKLAVTGVGGEININWLSKNLDSDIDTTDTTDFDVSGDGKNDTIRLYFDSDGDGKPEKKDDYLLYNAIRWDREGKMIDVTPYLKAIIPKKWRYVDDDAGKELKIRDQKFFVTKVDADNDIIKIGIPKTTTLPADTKLDKTWEVEGKKVAVYNVSSGGMVQLWIEGPGIQPWINATNWNQTSWMGDNLDGTLVVKAATGSAATLLYVSPDSIVTLEHDKEDMLGYNKVVFPDQAGKVSDGDLNESATLTNIEVQFRGPTLTLEKDEIQTLDDTLYTIEFDYGTPPYLRVRASAETTVSSGTKIKAKKEPGKNFLDKDKSSFIVLTVTEGEEKVPELEIVDEDTASKNMNLVLIGGPVANSLVADLVTAGKSKVDWYTSDGDIEVIGDYPSTGFSGIIVAGKNREATKAAADALAAAL
ncbi:S-layer protein [Candidatus Pyrohabitans sp.]